MKYQVLPILGALPDAAMIVVSGCLCNLPKP